MNRKSSSVSINQNQNYYQSGSPTPTYQSKTKTTTTTQKSSNNTNNNNDYFGMDILSYNSRPPSQNRHKQNRIERDDSLFLSNNRTTNPSRQTETANSPVQEAYLSPTNENYPKSKRKTSKSNVIAEDLYENQASFQINSNFNSSNLARERWLRAFNTIRNQLPGVS